MNKKIYGLMAFGVAAGFWACGSGDILEPNEGDNIMKLDMANQDDSTATDPSVSWDVMTKANCPRCFEGVAKSSSSRGRGVRSSSSINGRSSSSVYSSSSVPGPVPGNSSSSSAVTRPKPGSSSSSANPGPNPVSSSSVAPKPVSSSSSAAPGPASDFGTCAPARTPIAKGDTVSWVLKAKDPTLLMNASTSWTMVGGTPDAVNAVKGMGGRTAQTKYAASGDYVATAQVTVGAANYTVTCDGLHVNGDPITGCECTTEATSVDFTAAPGGAVTWSVAGCATGAGIGLTYEWDGFAGETAYSLPFTAAHPGYTPKLVVKSTDHSVVEVTCPTVKVTSGPEYPLKLDSNQVSPNKIDVANGGCMSITGTWANEYYKPKLTVVCDVKGGNVELTIAQGTDNTVTKQSDNGLNNVTLTVLQLAPGPVDISNVCISLKGAEVASCGLGTAN